MASQGPLSPSNSGTFVLDGGSTNWGTLTNAYASDNTYATNTMGAGGTSRHARFSDFGFSIPSGATVDGILVEIEASHAGTSGPRIIDVRLLGLTADAIDTTITALTGTDTYYSRGGSTSIWGQSSITPAQVNDSGFSVNIQASNTGGSTATAQVDHVRVTVYYTEANTAPTIAAGPTVFYGSLTRTGPQNTPAVVSFTATDPEEDGAGELDYEIRTATGGGGTLVASGTCTSGINQDVNIAYNASGISEGSNTLYLVVSDGEDDDEESFTLLRDDTAPVSFTPASDPSPVDGTRVYAVELTANDATSSGTDELTYEVRTAASGAGALLTSGNHTSSGTPFTTAAFTDDALEEGSNTRHVRVIDGAGNVREVSFTVTGNDLPVPVVSSITVVAPRRPPRPVLTLYPPLGQMNDWQPYEIPLTGIGGLVTYSRVPGGFGEMNVMVNPEMARWPGASQHPYRSVDSRFVTYGHVTLSDGDLTLFEGRLVKTTEVAGAVRAIRVMGYGFHAMRDAEFESSSSTTTTTGNIVRQVLANAAPFIRVATGSDFVDPQVEHAPEEFSLMMPADIMAQISSEGDDDGNPVDWAIWEGQRLHLKPRVAPSQPHYAMAAGDRRILTREADDSDLRGRVRISYTDAATGNPALTDWYSNRTGNHRRLTVAASELTETSANRLAQAYATLYSSPYLAITVETSHDDMLPGAYGEPMPAYLARAGEWWLVGDDTPLMAIDVQQDWSSGRTRIQLGDEGESYQAMLAWLERDIEQRRGGLNPVGGRAR